MNDQLQEFARSMLKDGLLKLTDKQQHTFRMMYSPKRLDATIDEVVDGMHEDQLDWAMQQVERTLEGINAAV